MIFLLLLVSALPGILLGKYIFTKWFNPVTIYTLIWYSMLNLYHLKLLRYYDLNVETWLYISGAYLSLLIGSATVYTARRIFNIKPSNNVNNDLKILLDGGKIIKIAIVVFSIIGFISAFQHWSVLIAKYGGILEVLLKSNEIYRLRVAGKLEGVLPYLHSFAFIGVVLSGIYAAYFNKFPIIIFLPMFAILIKEVANVGRSNILLAAIMFVTTFFIIKYFYLAKDKFYEKKIFRTVTLVILIFGFFIGSSIITRLFRGTIESYTGTSNALSSFEDNVLISPSIYLYLSAHVGVFNKYLEFDSEESEIGQYTFTPIYNLMSKFGAHEKIDFYHRGYFIPMWVNTGTFLREMHADYGIWGVFLVPYILGLMITFFWFRFLESGSSFSLIFIVYLFSIITFSFSLSVTRFGIWYISLVLQLIAFKSLEIIINKNLRKQQN
ncbi:MAG: oligosaccharide repeat unit polymerase [Ignavibacteriae bacterium]|nr:oligosaccharide repeat unit polymerase [Ignavibacteriota bacterium]NOG97541.1 oligosaccharide repeat unit polymerase [Ignavibacteriota bacterium]